MQNVNCPSCGAQIQFRSSASVMAVCGYCKTTVLKDADSVQNLGKMSEVLEDYSPIQIGTSGKFGTSPFTVIGRLQMRYSDGLWNEWFVQFDDGKVSWLGDASGQYTLTSEVNGGNHIPAFETLIPTRSFMLGGQNYIISDVRTAECIGGQGELPFKVGAGWQARVADLRFGHHFMTLDYSDPSQTKIYTGQAVTLDELQCQLLRDDDQVKSTSEQFKGKLQALSCPSCGSSASFVPGATTTLICPNCHSQIDTSGPVSQVLAAGARVEQLQTTLQLGAIANINGKQFTLIGLMQRSDNENTVWMEYLLHNPRAGFLWLIETNQGWARSVVLDEWPIWSSEDSAVLGPSSYQKLYRYPAKVLFAIGAFNWRVNVGYQTDIVEFQCGQNKLAAEITACELTWSLSSPVSVDQLHAWFGDGISAHKVESTINLRALSNKYIWLLLIVNLVPLILTADSWIWVAIGCAALYYPAKYLDSLGERE